jgi:uncharacterized protein
MKVLISEIPEKGIDLELRETIENDIILSPVAARLRIEKVGNDVVVKGNLRADIKLQCSRCLKEFCSELSVPVDVVYHPVEELKGEDKHEVRAEELNTDFYSGEEMDILALMEEQIVLNLPMKPLCAELCKGICPKCGIDLNVKSCTCNARVIDSRLEVLKKLLDKEMS